MKSTPGEELFGAGEPREIYRTLAKRVTSLRDDISIHPTKSQVTFRARAGFAYAWRPGQYVKNDSPVVVSFVLDRELHSARIKEVAQPSKNRWTHHVELTSSGGVDDELLGWIEEAYERVVRAAKGEDAS